MGSSRVIGPGMQARRVNDQWQDEIDVAREREALARHVFRMLGGGKKVQVVLLRSGRVWIGATDDRSAQKILADHPGGLIGVYSRGADWRALLDDLEEAGL